MISWNPMESPETQEALRPARAAELSQESSKLASLPASQPVPWQPSNTLAVGQHSDSQTAKQLTRQPASQPGSLQWFPGFKIIYLATGVFQAHRQVGRGCDKNKTKMKEALYPGSLGRCLPCFPWFPWLHWLPSPLWIIWFLGFLGFQYFLVVLGFGFLSSLFVCFP